MLKNYLAAALKNLVRNGLFSIINISGLAIGLAACILISLYVQNESSYDQHWRNADSLYRLNTTVTTGNNNELQTSSSAGAALPALKLDFPEEITRGSRILAFPRIVANGTLEFQEPVAYVDPDFTDMFEFETVAGDLALSLADRSSIALNEELARRLFGAESPVGKVITVTFNKFSRDLLVGAVFRLPAANTVLELPALVQFDPTEWVGVDENWTALSFYTYLQLAPGVDPGRIAERLDAFVDRHADLASLGVEDEAASANYHLALQNIRDIHLYSPFDTLRAGGNAVVVLAFSAISVLVLLIGCINFTILSTAKATQRAREVAVRKAIGATRMQLVVQYLGESFLIVLPSLLLALMLVELAIPFFSALVDRQLAVPYAEPDTWIFLLGLMVVVGFVGGLYPAFVLAGQRPGNTLRGNRSKESQASTNMRNALVTFQFSIAIALMIATAVIYVQVLFAANRDPGFNHENLLTLDDMMFRAEVASVRTTLKQEMLALPSVSSVGLSSSQPTQQMGFANNSLAITVPGGDGTSQQVAGLSIDHDFFSTYQIPLLAGRDYAQERDPPSSVYAPGVRGTAVDSSSNVIINESAVRQLGFINAEEALGRQLNTISPISKRNEVLSVIGVVADTHFFSMNAPPRAEAYLLSPSSTDVMTIRYEGNPQAILAGVRSVWERVVGDAELSTGFVDENMAREFERESTQANLLLSFSLLAIFITCMGLFGSAAFNIERRTREIGVRKVMGAEVREIVLLLIWQFSRPVILANVIAWPLTFWIMLNWLQRFSYRIDLWLLGPIFLMAGLVALSISWATVGGMAARAASAKPVLALKCE